MPGGALVFDSWAVLAFLQGEAAAKKVESLVLGAQQSGAPMWITSVNLGEVWYAVARSHSREAASLTLDSVGRLGLQVQDVDWVLARLAADFKARHRIAYADCFAAALAKQLRTAVITGDREFKQLEHEVKIHWL